MAIHNIHHNNADNSIDRIIVLEENTNAIVFTYAGNDGKNRTGQDIVERYVLVDIVISPNGNLQARWRLQKQTKGGFVIVNNKEGARENLLGTDKTEIFTQLEDSGLFEKMVKAALTSKFRSLEGRDKPLFSSDGDFEEQVFFNLTPANPSNSLFQDGNVTITSVDVGAAPFEARLQDGENNVLQNWTTFDNADSHTFNGLGVGIYKVRVKDSNNIVSKAIEIELSDE